MRTSYVNVRPLSYGEDLILCRVLPGLKLKSAAREDYDRGSYDSLECESRNEFTIRSPDQILPYCVINLDAASEMSKRLLAQQQRRQLEAENIVAYIDATRKIEGGDAKNSGRSTAAFFEDSDFMMNVYVGLIIWIIFGLGIYLGVKIANGWLDSLFQSII